jgi:hypothetical protein
MISITVRTTIITIGFNLIKQIGISIVSSEFLIINNNIIDLDSSISIKNAFISTQNVCLDQLTLHSQDIVSFEMQHDQQNVDDEQ